MSMPESPPAPDRAAERLRALIAELLHELRPGGAECVRLDSRLERDLGIDSLGRVELAARVERAFAVRLPDEAVFDAESVSDLLRTVEQARASGSGGMPDGGGGQDGRREDGDGPAGPGVMRALHGGAAVAGDSPAPDGFPTAARSLPEMLDWHLARHGERTHVRFLEDGVVRASMTYAGLAEAAGRVAGGLLRAGVVPGQCVALMLPSGLDFFRCFFGILRAGAVPVPMYPPARPSQVEEHLRRQAGILRNCQAPVLIAFARVRPLAQVLIGLAPELRRVVVPEDLDGEPPAFVGTDGDAPALIQYTSGSTGDPKGVVLSHDNLLANIRAYGARLQVTPQDVCVSWLPLYHDMGLIGAWFGSLYHACPLVLMSPLDFLVRPERWLQAIAHHRGTITASPNFAFDLCVKRRADMRLDGVDLSCWRLALNGAEPVNPDSLRRFAEAFADVGFDARALMPVYGLAECTVGLTLATPGSGARIDVVARDALLREGRAEPVAECGEGSVVAVGAWAAAAGQGDTARPLRLVRCGRPLDGHEVRIVDEAGRVLPERRVGAIQFRGASATRGYHRNPGATQALFDGVWLRTGDLGYLAEGEVVVTGRVKDMIVRGGRNFYPYELEAAVGELPGLRKGCVAAFGVADPDGGVERLVVVAERRRGVAQGRGAGGGEAGERSGGTHREGQIDRGGDAVLRDQIRALALDVVGLPPDDVVLVSPQAVLKTSSGKIRRAAIREAYLAGTLGASTRPAWRQVLALAVAAAAGRARRGLRGVAGWAYAGWMWGWLAMLGVPGVLVLLVLPGARARWAVFRAACRALVSVSGCRLRVEGLERLPEGPSVLVANHASYVDVFVLVAALPGAVRFVAKSEFAGHWLLARLFRRLGVLFVERFDHRRSVEDAAWLAERAESGPPLVFFAEGTFGPAAGLRAFRLGAFDVAARTGLPVVPIALAGTREMLRDETWRPQRHPLRITVGPPVYPEGQGWRQVIVLRDRVRAAILADCGEPDGASIK
ncbi:MAG: AMP-binding protein [Rhodocyclaceae bacterium]